MAENVTRQDQIDPVASASIPQPCGPEVGPERPWSLTISAGAAAALERAGNEQRNLAQRLDDLSDACEAIIMQYAQLADRTSRLEQRTSALSAALAQHEGKANG